MDGKKLFFSEDDLVDMRLGMGEEGFVFYYNDFALKVYHTKCGKVRLDEKTCKRMLDIHTNYVLLPKGVLYDSKHHFTGYYTDYIHGRYTKDIVSLKMKDFKEQLDVVYKELEKLANQHVYVTDLHHGNFCYDGDFFFVDPGSYTIEDNMSSSRLLTHNQTEFSNFIHDYIFGDLIYGPKSRKKKKISNYFEGYENLVDILDDDASEDETVKKYIKRIMD